MTRHLDNIIIIYDIGTSRVSNKISDMIGINNLYVALKLKSLDRAEIIPTTEPTWKEEFRKGKIEVRGSKRVCNVIRELCRYSDLVNIQFYFDDMPMLDLKNYSVHVTECKGSGEYITLSKGRITAKSRFMLTDWKPSKEDMKEVFDTCMKYMRESWKV